MISMNEKVAKTEFEKHKEKLEKNLEQSSELDKAFVSQEEKVLDPKLLNKKSLLDRMPNPSGWRLLVLPYKGKGVTEAGIQLVKETVDREALSTVICYVLKVGPLSYKDENKFGSDAWCKKRGLDFNRQICWNPRFRLEDDHEG